MIKIEKIQNKSGDLKYRLRIDDEVFKAGITAKRKKTRLHLHVPKGREGFEIEVEDPVLIRRIGKHAFKDIPKQVKYILFTSKYSLDLKLIQPLSYATIKREPRQRFEVSWAIDATFEKWKEPFTKAEFMVEFYRRLGHHYRVDFVEDEFYFAMSFLVKDTDATIEAELSRHRDRLRTIYDQTTVFLTSSQRESVVVFFDFPDSIRVPCEQYLLYFVQFLKDLGVSADTALTHEAGQVLFTVTPTDREEALDKIQSALDLYLKLPSNPISDSFSESIEVQRLESSILRLRSDLKLAAAESQAKAATIRAQNLIIDIQKGIIDGEILTNSVIDVTPKPEDKEDVIPGILALSTYEDKGVHLNLGEVLRRLKMFFSKR